MMKTISLSILLSLGLFATATSAQAGPQKASECIWAGPNCDPNVGGENGGQATVATYRGRLQTEATSPTVRVPLRYSVQTPLLHPADR